MQIKNLAPSLTEQWKAIYEKERPNLAPNAITGKELADFTQTYYEAERITDDAFSETLKKDVYGNALFSEKLKGQEPDLIVFRLADDSRIGIDLVSGLLIAENDTVREELTYRKGLDEADLENVVRTVEWLRCRDLAEERNRKEKTSCISLVQREDGNTAYNVFRTASHTENAYAALIRGGRCANSRRFFREFSAALQFPTYFGENWDALDECLCDMDWLSFRSLTIVIDEYEKLFGKRKRGMKNKEMLRGILENAAAFWAKLGIPFCVIAVCGED